MLYPALIKEVETHVRNLFKENENEKLVYHNLKHTEEVVAHATEIAANYNLNDEDIFILTAAAWFHDAGQLFASGEDHEMVSVKKMRLFFETKQVSEALITKIKECIMATKFPSHPQNILQEIICDADTYNFGTTKFKITDKLVRKEMELRTGTQFTNWYADAMFLLAHHTFFTAYCKEKLNAGKELNIAYLQNCLAKNN